MENEKKHKLIGLAKRLWRGYVKKYLRLIMATVVLLFIASAAVSVQPMLIQTAFDKIFKDHDQHYLMFIPPAILAIFAVQAATLYISTLLMAKFQNGLMADMRKDLFKHIIDNEIDFYSQNNSGNLIARVTGEVQSVTNAIVTFMNGWCRQIITSLGLVAVMFYQSWELSVVSLTAFAIAFYPLKRITTRMKKLTRQFAEIYANFNSRLLESFAGIRVVKAFGKEQFETKKVSEYIDEINYLATKQSRVAGITPPMMQILAGLAVAFVVWYGGHELIAGRMTQGNLVAFITSLLMVSRPIRSITNMGASMMNGYVAAERFFEVLDTVPRYISRDHGNKITIKNAEINFSNVVFEYPNGTQALKGITLTMDAGKKTALVGHSGSGKSTIFNLLLKFYDAKSGSIKIDGHDLKDASISSVRASIALVSQDIFIFDDTARNNIGYGKDGATEEEIIAAAKAAKCHDFIMSLPEGYDTKLGFFGQNLSGGQKQRIAIARAFVRNSPILLLDEATSALDPKTENEIQEALAELTHNRTTIVIAHRLSTVMNADKMILMDKGEIAAVGTHEELLKSSATYRDLFGI